MLIHEKIKEALINLNREFIENHKLKLYDGSVRIGRSQALSHIFGLYPNFPNVRFLLYSMVSGAGSILYGSKVGWDLRRHIEVPYHKKNDIRKGIQCAKSTGSVFGYFDYAV